ncbi:hypothetical protein ColLi_03881 [Colletotrichum liriopes]|uniref:Uncharacterized protein n=1 Tax=Colletotrichum liriopes TaxID=708192 RepID=A0AA37LR83_9PEZI|nr:hypothetical protein ColLi_03881 [Colletotrichum liriopes]
MLVVGVLGQVPKSSAVQSLLIFAACVWSFFSNTCRSIQYTMQNLDSMGNAATTGGFATGTSVLFGLTFTTAMPVIRKPCVHFLSPQHQLTKDM